VVLRCTRHVQQAEERACTLIDEIDAGISVRGSRRWHDEQQTLNQFWSRWTASRQRRRHRDRRDQPPDVLTGTDAAGRFDRWSRAAARYPRPRQILLVHMRKVPWPLTSGGRRRARHAGVLRADLATFGQRSRAFAARLNAPGRWTISRWPLAIVMAPSGASMVSA
jgi:hypothetical protein